MFVSTRLLLAGTAVAVLSTATVVHLLPHATPAGGLPSLPPVASVPNPPQVRIPSSPAAPVQSGMPPMRAPAGLWELLNRDTAATTRGQIELVRALEETIQTQIRALLQRSLGAS